MRKRIQIRRKMSQQIATNLSSRHRIEKSYKEKRRIVIDSLKKNKLNPVLHFRVAEFFYAEKKYDLAYPYYRDALLLNKKSPIYLCNFACCLDMIGKYDMAIQCWRELLSWSLIRIVNNSKMNKDEALSFKNDCRLRISITYSKIPVDKYAKLYFRNYFNFRNRHLLSTTFSKYYVNTFADDLQIIV